MHLVVILVHYRVVNKMDYDQIMSKLQYVCSKADGIMNASEIVKSVNLFMAIEWGNYRR